MAKALFDPDNGYYSRHVRTVGKRGDFSTSATTSTLLAKGIAAWIARHHHFHFSAIIEVGGGDGSLMRDVRRALGWWKTRRYQWHMVETSPVLQARQRETLGTGKVIWHQNLHSALEASHGRALIYHNELVDAFPVRLLQWTLEDSCWREIFLRPINSGSNAWQEVLQPLSLPAIAFSSLAKSPSHPKQRIELHQSYHQWLHSWAPHWKEGAMLTIDYGNTFPQIYHRRPTGSLRSYFHHQMLTGSDIYQNMGRQDITSDVNFTDLIRWGAELGWRNQPLLTQRDFLLPVAPAKPNPAEQYLLDEYGAGNAFKVLEQAPSHRSQPL